MTSCECSSCSCTDISLHDAIVRNAAVRDYTDKPVTREQIQKLLHLAVQSPTALHLEPWRFAVVQDQEILNKISKRAYELVIENIESYPEEKRDYLTKKASALDANAFYNAGTLVLVCADGGSDVATADSWLAAENLMLGASAMDLGACVIGLAISALNEPEYKELLDIPADLRVFVPIILGTPAEAKSDKKRNPAKIISWK